MTKNINAKKHRIFYTNKSTYKNNT